MRKILYVIWRRAPRPIIGRACELTKLGHQVRLMPAKDVKAYLKRNKNDAAKGAVMNVRSIL